MNYILNHDVRILIENYKVTIRKGVWNTVDGVIDASNFKNRDYFINFLKRFADGEKISDDEMESKKI